MTLFTKIKKLYTFAGVHKAEGRRTKPDDLGGIEDACFLVDPKGRVEWAGSRLEWMTYSGRKTPAWRKKIKTVSLKGAVVFPAFTECHTHLLYAGARAEEFERRNRGDSYLDIAAAGGGIRSTVRSTTAATKQQLERDLIERLRSLASQGATTVEIKTGYAGSIEEERRHLQLLSRVQKGAKREKLPRLVVTCLAAHSIPEGETETSWLAKVEGLIPVVKQLNARMDIFIEKGAFSLEGANRLMTKAIAVGIAVTIHADQLSLGGGTSLGVKLKAHSVDHVIEAGDEEIAKLAKSPTVAVLLPAADLYTRLAYPKARKMIDQGVRVALATDHNPGTSPGLDLALVGVLARTTMQMTLPEVFAAYTVNAAAALGLQANLGALSSGLWADFVCLKPSRDLSDLFYEIGPGLSHKAIASVWREGVRLI